MCYELSGWFVIAVLKFYCWFFFCFLTAGFAFVYFVDERDAEEAIRAVDNRPFGYDRRRLSVEWARVQYFSTHKVPLFCSLIYHHALKVASIPVLTLLKRNQYPLFPKKEKKEETTSFHYFILFFWESVSFLPDHDELIFSGWTRSASWWI